MRNEDLKCVEEIRKHHESHSSSGASHVEELLAIIDRMRAATREEVERVKVALHDAGCCLPGCRGLVDHRVSDGVRCETLARAALRAMGKEVAE